MTGNPQVPSAERESFPNLPVDLQAGLFRIRFAQVPIDGRSALGVELYKKESRSLNLQIEAANLSDHVNLLNFAGLFSGTAVAAPRSAAAHLRFVF